MTRADPYVRALGVRAARLRVWERDARRLKDLVAGSRIQPGPGLTVADVIAGLPPLQFTEAAGLYTQLRRTAPQLGLEWPDVPGPGLPSHGQGQPG